MNFLKGIFGPKGPSKTQELLEQGAIIVDVRSPREFASGSVPTAINIPVDRLASNLKQLPNKDHPIITCCASGMRSAAAASALRAAGYSTVHNGGPWQAVYAEAEAAAQQSETEHGN